MGIESITTWSRWARDSVRVMDRIHTEGEPVTPNDVGLDEIDDVHDAVRALRAAKRQAAAAKLVQQAAEQRVAELLGEGGAARIGDTVMRYTRKRTERCIDPAGVIGYITQAVKEDRVALGDIVNPTYVKRSWMDEAVRDTFYEWEQDESPSLTSTPYDRAPLFLVDVLSEDGAVFVFQSGGE